jgi:hypothetical protein
MRSYFFFLASSLPEANRYGGAEMPDRDPIYVLVNCNPSRKRLGLLGS